MHRRVESREGNEGDQTGQAIGLECNREGLRLSAEHRTRSRIALHARVDVKPATNLAEMKPLIGQKRDR